MTADFAPQDEAELSAVIQRAAKSGEALEILGGGTRRAVGGPVQAAATLSTAKLSGVSVFEPGALTLVAQAGTPLAEIEATLAEAGQRLAFEPCDWRSLLGSEGTPTLGGAVASNLSGPRRIQTGACRDSLIGVRFVDGAGRILKNGGRVMKNVTGYDLVKLLCGSHGALGVLTEVAFKTAPAPESAACLLLKGLEPARAVEALSAALASPYEVSGAAHLPADCTQDGAEAVTMLRLEGFTNSVGYRVRELAKRLEPFGAPEIVEDPDRVAAGWAYIRDVAPFAGRPGAVWRLSARPTDGPKIGAQLSDALGARIFYDWGGGLVWVLTEETEDAGAATIRSAVAALGGHATLIRAGASIRSEVSPFHPEPPRLAELSEAVRRRFDPAGVLNPGRMSRKSYGTAA